MSSHKRLDPRDEPVPMPCAFRTECADCGVILNVNDPVVWLAPMDLVCESCARVHAAGGPDR